MKVLIPALLMVATLARPDVATADEAVDYLYRLHCSGCHGMEGAGSKTGRIPAFTGLVGHFAENGEGRLYLVHVPGVANAALSDEDTAKLLNYVLRTWGGAEDPASVVDFTEGEVANLRSIHVDDVAALRSKLAIALSKRGISAEY